MQDELDELERTNPAVAKAAAEYDRVVKEIISRPPAMTLSRYDPRFITLPKVLGAAMRSMRKDAGLSQRALAELLHSHRAIIGRLEKGLHTPDLLTVQRWAIACDRRPTELMLTVDFWLGLLPRKRLC
jgi:ribosome-binding protein aMBF1 (putative translation factor)